MWERMLDMAPDETSFRRRAIHDFTRYIEATGRGFHNILLAKTVQKVCDDYALYHQRREGVLDLEDLEILEILPSIAEKFETWPQMKAHINFMRQGKDKKRGESVVLSTVHGVKGLERKTVFGNLIMRTGSWKVK